MGKGKGPTHASSVEIYLENTQCFPEDLASWGIIEYRVKN